MALIFGSGEPVSRLRRSLDLKGKVNLSVDEIIVPTLEVFDATRPPFRRTGIRWFADVNVPDVVGEFGRVRVFHTLPIDQLIDRIGIGVDAAARVEFFIGAGPAGVAGGAAVRTTEIMPLDSGGVISRPLPIQTFVDSVTPTSLSQNLWSFIVGPTTGPPQGLMELDIVLPAQPDLADPITNAPTLTIECGEANREFRCSVSGLYWDSLPLSSLT